jgi:TonB-linked SusC/RagA family outer membrane protein
MNIKTALAVLFFALAGLHGFSQSISIKAKNLTLGKIFSAISRQTGYSFVYANEQLHLAQKVSIELKAAPLKTALDSCLSGQPFTYHIVERFIVIRQATTNPPPAAGSITGTIRDETGQVIHGVTIFNRQKKLTAITGINGTFHIPAAENDQLEFTCIGYKPLSCNASAASPDPGQGNNRKHLLIMLSIDAKEMSDMVVMGYGVLKRKDITGSVSSIPGKNLRNSLLTDHALAGRAAGVQVYQPDGTPGSMSRIIIRGGSSLLGGNTPLYVIDGVQVNTHNPFIDTRAELVNPIEVLGNDNSNSMLFGTYSRGVNSLSALNPEDIERIDILKDASSTAIYGSLAANGVVVITTRKGKANQRPVVELQAQAGISSAIREKLLNASQYAKVLKEAALNLNEAKAIQGEAPDIIANWILQNQNRLGSINTDWQDLVLKTGMHYSAHLSLQGGRTKNRYYAALGYTNQEGPLLQTGFSRMGAILNLDKAICSRLRVLMRSNLGYTKNQLTNGIYQQALLASPASAPYKTDGRLNVYRGNNLGGFDYMGLQNPLLLLKGLNDAKTTSYWSSLALEYDLLNQLTFRSQASLNYTHYAQVNFTPPEAVIASTSGIASSENGTGTKATRLSVSTFYENTLTWDQSFSNGSHLNVVGGTTWQLNRHESASESAQGFANGVFNQDFSQATTLLEPIRESSKNSLLSFYLRSNCTIRDKYIFTLTGRMDASSKYAPVYRAGYFPSGGVAWRLSKENFLNKVSWIDDLKVKASAGFTGSQNMLDYLSLTRYTTVNFQGQPAQVVAQLGNNQLKRETTFQKDLGLEFSLFRSRLRGSFGYYEKWSYDLLFPAATPYSSSFGGMLINQASIRNKGIELELSAIFIQAGHFTWTGDLNIAGNRSKVENIDQDFSDPNHSLTPGNSIVRAGEPVGLIYGRRFTGLIHNQSQLEAYKAAFPQYARYQGSYLGIGDPMYQLAPADSATGMSTIDNKLIIGQGTPRFFGGFAHKLSYKQLSLDLQFTFSYGNQLLYLPGIRNSMVTDLTNKTTGILDHWQPGNPYTATPRLIYGENRATSIASNNIYDASFLKVKTIKLSWNVTPKWIVYAAATNLYTLTNYPGADPEVSNNPYSLISGYTDTGSYPDTRSWWTGVRFNW